MVSFEFHLDPDRAQEFTCDGDDPYLVKVMLRKGNQREAIGCRINCRPVSERLRFGDGALFFPQRGVSPDDADEETLRRWADERLFAEWLNIQVCRELRDNYVACESRGYVEVVLP